MAFSLILEHLALTIDVLWVSTLAISVLFLWACHAFPKEIAPIQSMPWTFQIKRNLDLDFQSVTYAAYHTNGLSRGSHLTLGPEALAWFILIAQVHWSLSIAVLLLLGWQAAELKEPVFASFLMVVWSVLAASGAAMASSEVLALTWREPAYFLMACGVFRTLGHALEDIPPLIATREDRFVPLREMPKPSKLLITLPAGYISEFVSALPPRLFIVQVFYAFQKLGYRPVTAMPWADAAQIGSRVGAEGWKAYPPVATLIEPLLETPSSAPSTDTGVRHAY